MLLTKSDLQATCFYKVCVRRGALLIVIALDAQKLLCLIGGAFLRLPAIRNYFGKI